MFFDTDATRLMTFACEPCGVGCWSSVGDDVNTWPSCDTCGQTMTVADTL